MSKPLSERLNDAKGVLDEVNSALGRNPGTLSQPVEQSVRQILQFRGDADHWLNLLQARSTALGYLQGLETRADQHDLVPLGESRVAFKAARFIGVQSFLSTTWAIADSITCMVGTVLCTVECGRNTSSPTQLAKHFVHKERKKTTAAVLFDSVHVTYGWPIAVSYALRNHFVHEGGFVGGADFFEGPTAAAAYRIATSGWEVIESKAKAYDVNPGQIRTGAAWPDNPRDDLRAMLIACEREVDDALGILLGSACGVLRSHVGLMLGED